MRLIDSDVIIWNWRSQESAATLLAAEPFAISAVTYMELVQGMRNARELKNLQADLEAGFTLISMSWPSRFKQSISLRSDRLEKSPRIMSDTFGWVIPMRFAASC